MSELFGVSVGIAKTGCRVGRCSVVCVHISFVQKVGKACCISVSSCIVCCLGA